MDDADLAELHVQGVSDLAASFEGASERQCVTLLRACRWLASARMRRLLWLGARHPGSVVRLQAIRVLEGRMDPLARDILATLIHDQDVSVRYFAILSGPGVFGRHWAPRVRALISHPETRAAAIESIGWCRRGTGWTRTGPWTAELLGAVGDADEEVRAAAVITAAHLRNRIVLRHVAGEPWAEELLG